MSDALFEAHPERKVFMAIRESTGVGKLACKALALPLSLSLALATAPPVALAENDGSAGGSLQAMSIGLESEMPALALSSAPSLYTEYFPVLVRAQSGQEEFADDYRASGSSQWSPRYCLFDMEGNGVPELLVRANSFADNMVMHVYTVESGHLASLGSYFEGTYSSAGNAEGDLFVAGWGSETSQVNSITIEDGQVVSSFVKAGKATAADPNKHVQIVNDYLASRNANWLSITRADDYSTLKREGKYSLSKANVTVAKGGVFTGAAKTPQVRVSFLGEQLVENVDYSVAYVNNKNAGKATAVITGKGNFRDTVERTFTITKAVNPLALKTSNKTLTVSQLAKADQSFQPITILGSRGRVRYANLSDANVAKVCKIKPKIGVVTVKKGTSKGVYVMKVKVSAAGNNNYKAKNKTVKIKVTVK